ncbi:semaphorin-4E isoform X3 [Micropterus salmoides]|uniref:semaphorin-4E isoform X3 n=1 Tax=Micropterus salmoides TaxID=27706 RepID=UPI0018ED67D2|nr:semaphorin-4E isoform X3 [Micropterus salmoides]XP_038575263.1 semaphorin-4E isoform X3 [Micropterus salmoides]XP_038575264.1 semaphorin-4E isoform X3 [Micropterus salmoides]
MTDCYGNNKAYIPLSLNKTAMQPLLSLSVFWLLPLALTLEENSPLDCVPRRSVPYHRDNAHVFREEGVFNYSTMLLREDLDLLVLGAREAVYALDLKDISKKLASAKWEVTTRQKDDCKNKGKDPEMECKNYIRILHKMEDNRMYVCGTNAFDPVCDYMSYADGNLTLENKGEDGKGKCPFDPFQRYASVMFENKLYSATSMNFLGSEPVLMRSSPVSIRTEFKSSWLNEPNFVSMAHMSESVMSASGDDDKVYLFFSETAVECDCYNKLLVSRVARVCKGDVGGQRTLQKKWTSFLKARIDCPVLESQLPYIIQDTYRWCDPQQPWKDCLFFAVFTPQSDTSDLSAVCVYLVSDISKVFAEGKYKTPVPVETSFVKWVMYSGDVPFPRPGACIDNSARKAGITQTLDLPDRTLQFIKDKPLMDHAIQPIGEAPLLVRRGAKFTRIIVNQVQAADGDKYHVMFIGTEEGTMLKAVNYNGEMFIIEEVQLFQAPHPIKILKFSNVTGQLYAGSDYGAAQIPLATCGRSSSCMDCVLARDPYCGWDTVGGKCIVISNSQRELIQSVKEGDASLCPGADPVKPVNQSIWLGGNVKLSCPSPSNLGKTTWEQDSSPLTLSTHLQLLQDGLLIFNASHSDTGVYRCLSVERSKAGEYTTTLAEYHVSIPEGGDDRNVISPEAQINGPSLAGLQVVVGLLLVSLLALLAWNFYKGHLPLPWNYRKNREQSQETPDQEGLNSCTTYQDAQRPALAEDKPLVSGIDNGSRNNNHTRGAAAFSAAEENDDPTFTPPSLQYIDDESEM